jgi:dolichyl-phosphate beta-glucosyltransferase
VQEEPRNIVVVVPCYNEEQRLDGANFLALRGRPDIALLFVDDGSSDRTLERLRELSDGAAVGVLALAQNGGKAEAVRRGMLHALEGGATIVGYMDADASTPAAEMLRLLELMESHGADVAMGARVRLLGSDVRRKRARHYLGRLFATAASIMLDLPVYDTQCGAKLFRDTPSLRAALSRRFMSRWAFDVELIGRLVTGDAGAPPLDQDRFLEMPLRQWCDVGGSKLGPTAMIKSGLELAAIQRDLRKLRASAQGSGEDRSRSTRPPSSKTSR